MTGGDADAPSAPGLSVGPISVDVDAPADAVYSLTTTFDDGGRPPGTNAEPSDNAEFIREFASQVKLPFGLPITVRTREAIRVAPPDTIHFRHLGGPVRGLSERITVEPLSATRSRVTYRGVLPRGSWPLRIAHRLLARPAIERVVRTHLAALAERARDRSAKSEGVHAGPSAASHAQES